MLVELAPTSVRASIIKEATSLAVRVGDRTYILTVGPEKTVTIYVYLPASSNMLYVRVHNPELADKIRKIISRIASHTFERLETSIESLEHEIESISEEFKQQIIDDVRRLLDKLEQLLL